MKKYILFILVLYFSDVSFSQMAWKWMHPTPQGNSLKYAKVFSANDWIAVGFSGTFMKTTNAGQNWYISHDADGFKVTRQAWINDAWFFNMTTGVLCGTDGQIWRTTNGGSTFDSIPSGTMNDLHGMHFINSSTGYICGYQGILLKTTDAGISWSQIYTGNTFSINNVYAFDNMIYCLVNSPSIVRTSFDGGNSWFTVYVSFRSNFLYDAAFKDSLNGLLCGDSIIAATTNGGLNWIRLPQTIPDVNYRVLYNDNAWYLSGSTKWIFRSTDFGVTWDSLNILGTQYYNSAYYYLDINGPNYLACGSYGLINSSTNSGESWVAHNYLGSICNIQKIWCDNMNGRVIASGSNDPYPFLVSTNGGLNWLNTPGKGIKHYIPDFEMLNSTTGYACGGMGKVFKTTNGGITWDSVSFIGEDYVVRNIDFIDTDTGYVCGPLGKVFKTVNGGLSWRAPSPELHNSTGDICMVNSNTGWMVGGYGLCLKTTDGAETWNSQSANYSYSLYDIQMLNAMTGYISGSQGTLRKTTNGGVNWDTVPAPYVISYNSLSFSDENTGYIVGYNGFTARTSNGGISWECRNSGGDILTSVYCKGYDSAFIGGYDGHILKQFNALTGSINWYIQVPSDFSLWQNFPNPFNPVTKIKFSIPKPANVTIKIYDLTGREIRTLFDNTSLNAGTITYDFDGSNLASGVYFYSLIINNDLVDTKKMVLLK